MYKILLDIADYFDGYKYLDRISWFIDRFVLKVTPGMSYKAWNDFFSH